MFASFHCILLLAVCLKVASRPTLVRTQLCSCSGYVYVGCVQWTATICNRILKQVRLIKAVETARLSSAGFNVSLQLQSGVISGSRVHAIPVLVRRF